MKSFWNFFKNLFKSNFTRFVLIKYITFLVQFINSIFIAKFLGPFIFGIYSFLTLVIQYFSYSGLGINYALNTLLALKKNREELSEKIWQNSLGIILLISICVLVIGFTLHHFEVSSFSKYSYRQYNWWIIVLTILNNFNLIFVNLFRVYGKLNEISFNEGIGPILILITLVYFNDNVEVIDIIYCLVLKNLFSLIIFIFRSPIPNHVRFNIRISKILVISGIKLLIYNLSYIFIMLSAKTLVSMHYTIEDLANYSFANTLSVNLLMIAGVFSFLFYPKMINKFGTEKNSENIIYHINKFNSFYLEGINALTFISVLSLPLINTFLGDYTKVSTLFIIIIIAQLLINSSLGYSTYLIASKKEIKLIQTGIFSILIIVSFGTIVSILNLKLEILTLGVLIAALFYLYHIVYTSAKLLNSKKSAFQLIYKSFGWNKIIPLIILISSTLFDHLIFLSFIPTFVYFLLNTKKLVLVIKNSIPIIFNNNLLKF